MLGFTVCKTVNCTTCGCESQYLMDGLGKSEDKRIKLILNKIWRKISSGGFDNTSVGILCNSADFQLHGPQLSSQLIGLCSVSKGFSLLQLPKESWKFSTSSSNK